jgi:RNA polymerase sigma-70 factor (ECF subfamily)
MDDRSDERLMELIGQEDEEAFTTLMRRHKDLVYGTAYRMLGPYAAETEDLAQQVFIKVWRAAPRYRPQPQTQFTTWLLTICRNCVFTQLKKSKRTQASPLEYHGEHGEEESHYPDHTMLTPAAEMLEVELSAKLHGAIQNLPESQRAVLTLRQQEQLDYEEIAQIMKVSASSVKSLLFRARDTLRENLKDYLK